MCDSCNSCSSNVGGGCRSCIITGLPDPVNTCCVGSISEKVCKSSKCDPCEKPCLITGVPQPSPKDACCPPRRCDILHEKLIGGNCKPCIITGVPNPVNECCGIPKVVKCEKKCEKKKVLDCDPCVNLCRDSTIDPCNNPCNIGPCKKGCTDPCACVPKKKCLDDCIDREFLLKSDVIRAKLGKIQNKECCNRPKSVNAEECKYQCYHYNGLFTKGLERNLTTGELASNLEYEKLKCAVLLNNQKLLGCVKRCVGAELTFVDPLASQTSILVGAPQCAIRIADPPRLSSHAGAAEMVELYAQMLARDAPFITYSTDPVITNVLTLLNQGGVPKYLPDHQPPLAITLQSLFRGISAEEQVGPYISQLLLLNILQGGLCIPQKYQHLPLKADAIQDNFVNEWGRNFSETLAIECTKISTLPPFPTVTVLKDFIHDGRSLAEAVRNDPVYQFFFQAALILKSLGIAQNPGFPIIPNTNFFLEGTGSGSVQCAIAEVTGLALKHAWYNKWQLHRKLRPEAFGLWIDNIKNGRVANQCNYDITNLVLNHPILPQVQAANALWGPAFANSFTLAMTYREGSPLHPAYPSGHASIAGASATILKAFYDTNKPWASLPGIAVLNRDVVPITVNAPVAQSDATGTNLVDYTGLDIASVTICGEINKLASNVAFGRNWAGIHYRSDAIQGILLGEQVAIKYLEDMFSTSVVNNVNGTVPTISFKKFNGETYTLKPTICRK